jgi:rhodanese-related sulfurtransferase
MGDVHVEMLTTDDGRPTTAASQCEGRLTDHQHKLAGRTVWIIAASVSVSSALMFEFCERVVHKCEIDRRALWPKVSCMNAQLQHYKDKLAYEIDSSDLYSLKQDGGNVIIIDTRAPELYAAGHVPGAINLPHRLMTAESTAHLDRSALIVTYCNGIGCNGSTKGAIKMTELGFTVKELLGGIDWWKREGYVHEVGPERAFACGC